MYTQIQKEVTEVSCTHNEEKLTLTGRIEGNGDDLM